MVLVLAGENNDCGRKNGGRIDSSPGLLRLHGAGRLGGWVLDKCGYHWGEGEGIPDGGVSMGKSTRSEGMAHLGGKIEGDAPQGGDGCPGRGGWKSGRLQPPAAAWWKSSDVSKACHGTDQLPSEDPSSCPCLVI